MRAYPEEGYFPTLHAATTRSGEVPPVSVSPVGDSPGSSDGTPPGAAATRDLAAAARRSPEASLFVFARSEAALLAGEGLPEAPELPPAGRSSEQVVLCDWESPVMREAEAADLALAEVVRACARPAPRSEAPTVNLFGPPPSHEPNASAEVAEMERLMGLLGVGINARVLSGSPPGAPVASVEDFARLPGAWANVVLYREAAETATLFLQDEFGQPRVTTPPIGSSGTGSVLRTVGEMCGLDKGAVRRAVFAELASTAKLPWYARLAVPETFRGRRAAIFGDLTYSLGLGYTLAREIGLEVAWAGTYLLHLEQDFRFHAGTFTDGAFAEDDPDRVAARVEETRPDLLVGTRLEAPVAKALGIPFLPLCPPVAGRPFVGRPLMGYAGSSAVADALEGALRSPTGGDKRMKTSGPAWTEEALLELEEVPAFLRGRARRLAEEEARQAGSRKVTLELLARSRQQ